MMALVKYEAARLAINDACSVDEVKQIKDVHEAMRAYAKQSGDFNMANQCAEIRIRAERRLGQMLKQQKENGLMNTGSQLKPGENNSGQSHDDTAPKLIDIGITKSMSSRAQIIADVPDDKFEEVITEFKDQQKELTSNAIRQLTEKPHVLHNSGENEWYTPACYIESARLVMGSIDTDPASCELANQIVKAKHYFTKVDNGITYHWDGNVWLNPPYSQPEIGLFIDELFSEKNNILQYCVLVNNATDTKWFQLLLEKSDQVCFVKGRIKFIDKNGKPSGSPLQGQAIFYRGINIGSFINEFTQYGAVL